MEKQTVAHSGFFAIFGLKGAVYYEAIAMVIFSYVKISSFRTKANLVFHWCLYSLRSKRFRASSSGKLRREQKKE